MKKCSKCKEQMPLRGFYKSKTNGNDGLSSWCKQCFASLVRSNYLKRTYGIDSEEYEILLATQDYGCAICGKEQDTYLPKHKHYKMLAVDHDEETGKIRGILCENCNRGIGLLNHNVNNLQKAIDYLNQF